MSAEAYAAERDGCPIRIQREGHSLNPASFDCVRSEGEKILHKVRRLITAMELELVDLPSGVISSNDTLDEWAKNVIDEISVFLK